MLHTVTLPTRTCDSSMSIRLWQILLTLSLILSDRTSFPVPKTPRLLSSVVITQPIWLCGSDRSTLIWLSELGLLPLRCCLWSINGNTRRPQLKPTDQLVEIHATMPSRIVSRTLKALFKLDNWIHWAPSSTCAHRATCVPSVASICSSHFCPKSSRSFFSSQSKETIIYYWKFYFIYYVFLVPGPSAMLATCWKALRLHLLPMLFSPFSNMWPMQHS